MFCLHSRNFLVDEASLSEGLCCCSCILHAICIFTLLLLLVRFSLHYSQLLQKYYQYGAKTHVLMTILYSEKHKLCSFSVNSFRIQPSRRSYRKIQNVKLPTTSSLMKSLSLQQDGQATQDTWSQTH